MELIRRFKELIPFRKVEAQFSIDKWLSDFEKLENKCHNIADGETSRKTAREELTELSKQLKPYLNEEHVLSVRYQCLIRLRFLYDFLYGNKLGPIMMIKEVSQLDYSLDYLN